MSKTVSSRLEDKEIDQLNQIADEESIDRSTLIRKFLRQQIKEYEMKKVGEYYRKGVMSLQEAATQAKVSLYEMMDYAQKEKIFPPTQSTEEIMQDLKNSTGIFEKLK
jgi:metal-responsive CopG/Arc/MetJ family transcriptional regulator